MITDHVWRPTPSGWTQCAFMNCRRPPTEHERAVSGMRPDMTPEPRASR